MTSQLFLVAWKKKLDNSFDLDSFQIRKFIPKVKFKTYIQLSVSKIFAEGSFK